ncbi:terminase family protein [bacterium]|nr:terminase family protein [bacterium]
MDKSYTINLKLLDYQEQVLISKAPYLGLIGGTGVGKTFFLPTFLFTKMVAKPGRQWIVSAPTIPTLKKNPIRYTTEFFDQYQIPYTYNKNELTITTEIGVIYFISAETPDAMQGIHAAGIIGDEAGLYSKLWWDTAVQRASLHKGTFILLLTTPYTMNWLKTSFYDLFMAGDKDYFLATVPIRDKKTNRIVGRRMPWSGDNPYYNTKGIKRAFKTLPDWKFKMLYCAMFTRPAGLVFDTYEKCDPFDIPDDWYKYIGLDFGFNHPCGIIWIAKCPDTGVTYVYKEYKEVGKTTADLYMKIKEDEAICYADPAAAGTIADLQAMGLDIRKGLKDRKAGVLSLLAAFRTGELKVFSNLSRLIDELQTYHYLVDKQGDITEEMCKVNDDLIDPLRYAHFTSSVEDIGLEVGLA